MVLRLCQGEMGPATGAPPGAIGGRATGQWHPSCSRGGQEIVVRKEDEVMSVNPTTCSNCGTENPPESEQCVNCGLPLTGSADEAMCNQVEAQSDEGLLDARVDEASTAPGQGSLPPTPPR